jgi:putative nucleotidyltransferase with HDIG domain
MPITIAVQDLRVGMFVHLEGGWMSHPFPLSSFRISSADQIETIRRLGLSQVRVSPDKSEPPPLAALPSSGPEAAAIDPAVESQALQPRERREQLLAQREASRLCEGQYEEASLALQRVVELVPSQPVTARLQTEALSRAMLDKMLSAGELCIRLLNSSGGDRTAAHSLNVSVIAMLMGRSLGLAESELMDIGVGALLHDVGKLDLPERVRYPEACTSSSETNAYREHVHLGLVRARRMGLSEGALQVLAQHHEQADGSGFPQRLQADAMAPAARIVAVVNRYDNLCNPGPRGHPLTPHEAVSLLFAQNRHKFDAVVLNAFIRMMGVYPAGSVVQLTDDRFAMVIAVNSTRPLKPRVLVYQHGVPRDEALLIDLEHEPDLGIRRSLPAGKLPLPAFNYLMPRPRVAYYFESLVATTVPAGGVVV